MTAPAARAPAPQRITEAEYQTVRGGGEGGQRGGDEREKEEVRVRGRENRLTNKEGERTS